MILFVQLKFEQVRDIRTDQFLLYPLELSASESTSKETSDRPEQPNVDRSRGKEESARERPKGASAARE